MHIPIQFEYHAPTNSECLFVRTFVRVLDVFTSHFTHETMYTCYVEWVDPQNCCRTIVENAVFTQVEMLEMLKNRCSIGQ